MSQYKIQCTNPDCARHLRVPDTAVGRRIRCPACQQELRVPGSIEDLRKLEEQQHFRLRVARGPAFVGNEYTLDTGRAYTFGRSDECNVQLPGPTVSKRHFSLHWVNNQWVLEDLNTTTGTQVDGLAVTKHALRGGETIEMGAYALEVLKPGQALSPTRASSQVVIPATNAEPLPIRTESDAEREVREAEQRLRDVAGFREFRSEHLDAAGRESSRHYTLSLTTRLLGLAGLLVGATLLSLFGKYWFFDRPKAAAPAVAYTDPTLEPLPTAFEDALAKRDFELAGSLLKDWKANNTYIPELCGRIEERLNAEIRAERARLYQLAEGAMRAEDWKQVDQLINLALAPGLGPLTEDWVRVKNARRQQDYFAKAQALREKGRWADALAELETAGQIDWSNPRVSELKQAFLNECGAGLKVVVSPEAEGVEIKLDGQPVAAAGREQWKLSAGTPQLRVVAPGYFETEQPVELKYGQLIVVAIELEPLAPPQVWALVSLARAQAAGPLWVAAKRYAGTAALPPAVTSAFVEQSAGPAAKKLGKTDVRVARIELKSGDQFTARVWSDTASGLTLQTLPQGDNRVVKPDDIARREDLSTDQAAGAILAGILSRREAGQSQLETLEQLAKLWLDLGSQEDLAARVCGEHVDECLRHLEHACGLCAGAGSVPCPACAAKGSQMEMVTCSRCNGSATTNCTRCGGSGKSKCDRCGGSGKIIKTSGGGLWQKEVTETCPTCKGAGKVTCGRCRNGKVQCTKCKGAGRVEEKVSCPQCKKGEIPCPACQGGGTKEAMTPETRRHAETEAAKRSRTAP